MLIYGTWDAKGRKTGNPEREANPSVLTENCCTQITIICAFDSAQLEFKSVLLFWRTYRLAPSRFLWLWRTRSPHAGEGGGGGGTGSFSRQTFAPHCRPSGTKISLTCYIQLLMFVFDQPNWPFQCKAYLPKNCLKFCVASRATYANFPCACFAII